MGVRYHEVNYHGVICDSDGCGVFVEACDVGYSSLKAVIGGDEA